jgi:hypothetical protein
MVLEDMAVQLGVGGFGMFLMYRLASNKMGNLEQTQEKILLILDKILSKL